LAQYTVPGVDRFYLVGPFMHPGGGVYGAGRATAMRMFEHFGMDFDKVAGTESNGTNKTTSLGTPRDAAEPAAKDPAKGSDATLYGPANEDLMVIRSIEREGNSLVLKGQAYGSMALTASLRPEEARRMLRLLKWSLVPFLLSFLFRRSKQ
jgi:hypothetical protein